ncbi:hypothetical protein POM88_016374 [Heracleum sosnowskyi]|uniref:AFG1-like ATPase n=1 Tax=Heracleum sosnowskyi TaxID=360622 RepID=A0AAD8INR0_9APIA|nr:hypothetical protein POM88_016374 [Heracleum sosnowskyi]
MVTDVANALILNRLFGHLFNNGVILVATSNRAPDNLYERGLQRDLFLPFITTLKEKCADKGFYFIERYETDILKQKFEQLIGSHSAGPQEVEVVMGRRLLVPLGANGCAYFLFEELCDRPLGAADYFGLFKSFHTLVLDGVPIFGLHNRIAAYRVLMITPTKHQKLSVMIWMLNKDRSSVSSTDENEKLSCNIAKIASYYTVEEIAPVAELAYKFRNFRMSSGVLLLQTGHHLHGRKGDLEKNLNLTHKLKDNMSMLLKKLAEVDLGLNLDIGAYYATISSENDENTTPLTA